MLEVRYQNTIADLRSVTRAWPWWKRLYWAAAGWSLLLLCALPPTLLLALLGAWYALAGGWILLGLLAMFIKYRYWRSQRALLRATAERLREMTIRISSEQFEASTEWGWARCGWSVLDQVVPSSKYIYLVTRILTVYAIPKRAFETPAQAEEFAQAAVEYHRSASQSTTRGFTAEAASPPTAEDAMQVSYRNTPAEFASLQFEGLRKRDQPAAKKTTWRTFLSLFGMSIFFALVAGWGDPALQLLCGSVSLFCFAVAMLGLLQPVFRWLALPTYKRRSESERVVTIKAEGVFLREGDCEVFCIWENYSSIADDDRFMVLYEQADSHVGLLIPKRAFARAEEAERFAALAKSHWQRVHPDPEPVLPEARRDRQPLPGAAGEIISALSLPLLVAPAGGEEDLSLGGG